MPFFPSEQAFHDFYAVNTVATVRYLIPDYPSRVSRAKSPLRVLGSLEHEPDTEPTCQSVTHALLTASSPTKNPTTASSSTPTTITSPASRSPCSADPDQEALQGRDWSSRMQFQAVRLGAVERWPRSAPGLDRPSGWAPRGGGERRGLPPRPPHHSADGRRGSGWAGGRAETAAGVGAVSGGSVADGPRGREEVSGADGRGNVEQEARSGEARRGAAVAPAGTEAAGGSSTDAARGVPGSVLAREAQRGGAEVGTKRQPAAPPAHHPPPKRMAVSARRQFPPGCGRDAACPLDRADGGSRFRAARADVNSDALDKAAAAAGVPRPPLAGCNDGVLSGAESLGSAFAGAINKVSAADGAGPVAKGGHHAPAARLLAKREIVSASRTFPPACGRDAVPLLPVEVQLTVKSGRADDGLAVSAAMVADGDCSGADEGGMDVVATPWDGATDEPVKGEEFEDEIPLANVQHVDEEHAKVHLLVQEHLGSQVSVNVTLHKPAACGHGASVPAIGAVEVSVSTSDEKTTGSRIQCGEKISSCVVAKEFKVTNSTARSSFNVAAESVCKDAKMDNASSVIAVSGSGKGATMRSKMMLTQRKTVRPAKGIQIQHAPLSENKEEKEFGRHVKNTDEFAKNVIKQTFTSSNKRPLTQSKVAPTVTDFFDPKKKLKVKSPVNIPVKLNSKCALGTGEKLADKGACNFEDDDILEGLAVREGKLEFYLKNSSHVSSHKCQRTFVVQNADIRSKVKMLCRRFEIICRTIAQAVDQHSLKVRRIDLAADKAMRKLPDYIKHDPVVGEVPGVEVGDAFLYRVQLSMVGLHRPYQGGIDWIKDNNDILVAISIVASGGYPDKLFSSDELVYTGSGGKLAGRNSSGDQKLERGNLALKNCIKRKCPVRVIHGFKGQNNEEGSHSRAKEITTFTYDGLYHVVDCWREGQEGSKVCKYKLQRIPGQPELPHGRKTGITS